MNYPKTSNNLQHQLQVINDHISSRRNDNTNELKEKSEVCHDPTVLWSLDEPIETLFCAQGLINHRGINGKSVFITWNDDYLINFVFKTSQKDQRTTLTKVRLIMPKYDNENQEEIKQIIILECNTFLVMWSGHVYYFSSVKSLQLINWLSGVRCMSLCSRPSSSNTFSLIRFKLNIAESTKKQLCIEVYLDCVNFVQSHTGNDYLLLTYDITFDDYNFFECQWNDDQYTILNLYVTKENIDFLQELSNMGTNFFNNEDPIELMEHQNIQIFTISGNMFILIGAIPGGMESLNASCNTPNHYTDYRIQLLNCYTTNIEYIQYECDKEMLIVLLQCGYIDIWYKSKRCCGALLHKTIEISTYLHYDYSKSDTTFYFVTINQIIQLQIILNRDDNEECVINKNYKCIGGMMACTWVPHLNHLICLSTNNIFYHIIFQNDHHSRCESITNLFALTEKDIKELLQRSNVLKKLKEKPLLIEQNIVKENDKQIIIAMANKNDALCKKFVARVEYHYHLPKAEDFQRKVLLRQFNWVANDQSIQGKTRYYVLLYLKFEFHISESIKHALSTTFWYLHLYDNQENGRSVWLNFPGQIFLNDEELCLIALCYASTSTSRDDSFLLKAPILKLTTFLQHSSQYLCINFNINIKKDIRTYKSLFTTKIYTLTERQLKNDFNFILQQFRKSDVLLNSEVSKTIDFNYVLPMRNPLVFTKILKTLNFNHEKYNDLSNDIEISVFFLGQYLISLLYKVHKKQLILTSTFPIALFYMKIYCLYILQNVKDENQDVCLDNSNREKQLSCILQMESNMQQLNDKIVVSNKGNTNANDSSIYPSSNYTTRLDNLERIYLTLRTECWDIYR